ncbi:MAG: glycosyl hydrolase 115 family protein [Bacteroidales bacterium]|nr:glycosyl hydrolase 115 family protein [Bacteroidales bacterium]
MKRILFLVSLLALLASCDAGNGFRMKAGDAVTVTSRWDEAVVGTALDIFGKDVRAVLSADCDATERDGRILLVRPDDPDFSSDADVAALAGRHEAFLMKVLPSGQLLIAGSDAHGAAFGLLELSRMLGVSPWEWWADCVPVPRREFYLKKGFKLMQEPSVAYRGIFINDEDFAFIPWVTRTSEPTDVPGRIGPQTHARIFELLLRLRANTFWPAMHGCSVPFFLTEENRAVAEKYGIYIGTSHCEPMASNANGEWRVRGEGEYNFITNRDRVMDFWRERVTSVASQEVIYTLGMRGIHDGPMSGADTPEEQKEALAEVISAQRELLAELVDPDPTRVPQVFIPYKEVLQAYKAGLQVPEDVTLMWCDDNYGYIRHFPDEAERARPGGNGIYYHVSYWGRPHDYLWLGTFSPALLYQQMGLAYDKGIRQMWILNVGDIKPEEYQIELFMDMAWEMDRVRSEGWRVHLHAFLEREFGRQTASRALPLLLEHYRLAYIRKPEFMGNTREEERDPAYRVVKDLSWDEATVRERMKRYSVLFSDVETLSALVPEQRRTAFYHLVQYPVQAAAKMNEKALTAQLARHGKASWTDADAAYDAVQELTLRYNQGKWDGMMNAAPRSLPVFTRFPHDSLAAPLPEARVPLAKWNAAEGAVRSGHPTEGLGYEGGAVALETGGTISFSFRSDLREVTVSLRMVPTHPVSSPQLRITLSADGQEPLEIPYETYDRSEEWKENVLNNQAVREVTVPLQGRGKHTLTLGALDEGIILDQVFLFEPEEKS